MEEINYLLFQSVLGVTFIAAAAYLVFFISQNKKIRKIARMILLVSGVLQTLHIGSRFILAGHTPITSQHEAVVFFAWATTWAYLSFRWRYTVKNFGTFVSILIFCLLLVSSFSSRDFTPSGSGSAKYVASNSCRSFDYCLWIFVSGLLWRAYVSVAGAGIEK